MSSKSTNSENTGLMQGGSLGKYVTGYVLSIVLTLVAYFIVVKHVDSGHDWVSHGTVIFVISALAVAQFIVQIVYFLHLGKESNPQWNRLLIGFMTIVVLVLFFGSIWIMANLDYHHGDSSTDGKVDTYIMEEEAIEKSR